MLSARGAAGLPASDLFPLFLQEICRRSCLYTHAEHSPNAIPERRVQPDFGNFSDASAAAEIEAFADKPSPTSPSGWFPPSPAVRERVPSGARRVRGDA